MTRKPTGKTRQDQQRFARDLIAELVAVAPVATESGQPSAKTSIRLPTEIKEAIQSAVSAGWYRSASEFYRVVARDELLRRAVVDADRAALEEHFRSHPEDQPGLVDVVIATAFQEGHPAAERPDLVDRAVAALGPDADVDLILAWTAGALTAA